MYQSRPNGGLRDANVVESVALAADPALMPRLVLFPSDHGLSFVYQFYVDEKPLGRSMVLVNPSSNTVVRKTRVQIE